MFSGDCIDSGTRAYLMSFLSQNLMILCEFQFYTCGISIALVIHSFDPRWGFGIWGIHISTNLPAPLGLKCVEFHGPLIRIINMTILWSENLKGALAS